METVKGARNLFRVRAVSLGWYVLSAVLWSFPFGERFELWFKASAVLWLAHGAPD